MTKTVAIRQPPAPLTPAAAAWVDPSRSGLLPSATAAPEVPTSRMTFDVPKSLHMRFKMQCLRRGKHEYEIGSAIMERAVTEMEKE